MAAAPGHMREGKTQAYNREITVIAKGASLLFGGTIIGSGLKYLFEAMVARHLGPEMFGLFFLGLTVFTVLGAISTLGFHNGVLRYVALFRGIGDEARVKGTILLSIRIAVVAAAVISLLLLVFSRTISVRLFHEAGLTSVLRLFTLSLVFTVATEIMVFSIQAFQILKYRVLVRMIFEPGLRIVLVVLAFWIGWKLNGVLIAFLVSHIFGAWLALSYLKRVFPLVSDPVQPVYETRKILSFSWPLFFVGFLDQLLVQVSTLMLGHYRTSQEVGVYGAAQRTGFLIPIVLTSFNAIFAPIIADLYNRNEHRALENLFKVVTQWIFTISLPAFLVLAFQAEDILGLWGEQYRAGAVCLVIICCAQMVNCGVGSVGFVIMMTGRTVINLINNVLVFLMILVLNYLLIPRYGLLGAAASLAIALSLINLVRLVEVYLILRIHPYRAAYFKPILAGGLSLAASWAMGCLMKSASGSPLLRLVVQSSVIGLVYVIALLVLGINEEDKIVWRRVKEKILNKGT